MNVARRHSVSPLRRIGWFDFVLVFAACVATACAAEPGSFPDGGRSGLYGGPVPRAENNAIDTLDLLVVVDNSSTMPENQSNLVAQLRPMIEALKNPPDTNMDGRPDHAPVRDIHVGVVSTDLGTPGATVPGCANSDLGDDGLLNPIRNGQALARHQPWTRAPMGFRPDDCMRPDQFPSFISFSSGHTNVMQFAHDFHCNAALYVGGCGLEQPLEAAYRAVVWHRADDRPGNMDPNSGFLRENALLAILVLTDEEDGSVRDCRFAEPGVPCNEAIDVFQMGSTRWGAPNLNMRFYMYQPGRDQDPTWPLERYVDPRNPARGYLSVKPGHPERVLFAAIAGVPLALPTRMAGGAAVTDWDALLGTPDAMDRENFATRNAMSAIDTTSTEGPISMRQANLDANCPDRVVPACRREGTTIDPARPACNPTEQYFAWPGRRIAEIARRFDESPLCDGAPCRNGIVSSICRNDYGPAIRAIVQRIQSQLSSNCLSRPLPQRAAADGNVVTCIVWESLPQGAVCDANRARRPALDAHGRPLLDPSDPTRVVCTVAQLPTTLSGSPNTNASGCFDPECAAADRASVPGAGFYYDTSTDPTNPRCTRRISFTPTADPLRGVRVRLECTPLDVPGATPGRRDGRVGAACSALRQPFTGAPGDHNCGGGACFEGTSVYLQAGAGDCASGYCLVYHWDEFTNYDERARRQYCTCRCDGRAGGNYCACPTGFTCTTIFGNTDSNVAGSYCVRGG